MSLATTISLDKMVQDNNKYENPAFSILLTFLLLELQKMAVIGNPGNILPGKLSRFTVLTDYNGYFYTPGISQNSKDTTFFYLIRKL